jgi:hypothetical protein
MANFPNKQLPIGGLNESKNPEQKRRQGYQYQSPESDTRELP